MEGNEVHTICRLCLRENDNFIYVFESKGIHGWTAANGITELLRIQVSADDIYPKSVCVECMGILEDFKVFKDICENSIALLDRAYLRKRGIGRDEESIGETLNCEGNHSELQLKEEDLNVELEEDPLDLTENERPIKSEIEDIAISNEMPPNEAIESSNDPCFPDKNEDGDPVMTLETDTRHLPSSLSLTALDCNERIPMESDLSPPFTMTGDIPCKDEMGALQEEEERDPLGDMTDVKLNVSQLNGAFTEIKEEPRGEGSNHEFAGDIVTSSRLQGSVDISEVKEECYSPSVGHDLDVSIAELRSTDKGIDDPLDITSLTFTLKKEECEVMLCATSSHCKPTESAHTNDTEQDIASYVQSDVGEGANRTSDLRALRPWTHVSRKGVNDTGGNAENGGQVEMEMRTGGTLQQNLEGTDNKSVCNSSGMCFAAKSNLRKQIESHLGEKMSKSEVYLGKESVGRDSLACANESIHVKSEVNLKPMSIHIGDRPFQCDICDKRFKQRRCLLVHFKVHSSDKPFKCSVCGKGFIKNSALKSHLRIHTGERPFKCDVCNKGFTLKSSLKIHSTMHSGYTYNCEQCGKVFPTQNHLRIHLETHTGERPFKCGICDKRFNQRSHLVYHSKIHSSDKPFKCNECGKGFIKNSLLKSHFLLHTGERPFKCDICNKGFLQKNKLSAHSKIHSGDAHNCEHCGKGFTAKSGLNIHLRIHTGERPFKCDFCDKRFTQRGQLVAHSLIHSTDQPYKCNVCGKGFMENRYLIGHAPLCTGERPFKCDICNKQFKHKWTLAAHFKIHSGDTYNCKQCGKGFTRRCHLKVHLRTHTR